MQSGHLQAEPGRPVAQVDRIARIRECLVIFRHGQGKILQIPASSAASRRGRPQEADDHGVFVFIQHGEAYEKQSPLHLI